MPSPQPSKTLPVFAPAKINLFLHVTGRRENGYHELESLVAFADIGDRVIIAPSPDGFSFQITGPYAGALTGREKASAPDSGNLVVRAAQSLADNLRKDLDVTIVLEKNLPVAAGIGGGSADAAAAIRGLMEWWGVQPQSCPELAALLLSLGADVPVCFSGRPAMMRGTGDDLSGPVTIAEMPVILVNPARPCPTGDVFRNFNVPFTAPMSMPDENILADGDGLIDFLARQDNMLTGTACRVVPEISEVLDVLRKQDGCRLARMSGSGATCFGLFTTELMARTAAESIQDARPEWWVETGCIGRA